MTYGATVFLGMQHYLKLWNILHGCFSAIIAHILQRKIHNHQPKLHPCFFHNKTFFFPSLAAPLINEIASAIWERVRVRAFPRRIRTHYLTRRSPLPAITPIWGEKWQSKRRIFSFLDCFAPGSHSGWSHLTSFTSAEAGGGMTKSSLCHRATTSNSSSQSSTSKIFQPNEHSCDVDRGDLNYGFVMTFARCSEALERQKKKKASNIPISCIWIRMKGKMTTSVMSCKPRAAFNGLCWRHCYVNMPKFCYQWVLHAIHCKPW